MASVEGNKESEDYVNCSVCLCEYDDSARRPKFLPCAHSLCLSCLEVNRSNLPTRNLGLSINFILSFKTIYSNGSVVCPLCRNVVAITGPVSGLPNNGFALHILKLRLNSKEATTKKAHKLPKYKKSYNNTSFLTVTTLIYICVQMHVVFDMWIISHIGV